MFLPSVLNFCILKKKKETRSFMKKSKKSNRNSKDEEMTLVDCYYIPTVIAEQFRLLREHCAEQFRLLREHCALEVEKELAALFPKVTRESREDVGEVVVSYDENDVITCEITLSPIEVSKLEKEISADRLKKYIETKIKG